LSGTLTKPRDERRDHSRTAMAVAGLLKFWRKTRDRLFFGIAFWTLAVNRLGQDCGRAELAALRRSPRSVPSDPVGDHRDESPD